MTFEEHLKREFHRIHPEVLDDDIPDAFERWLATLDGSDYMELAEEWGAMIVREARELGRSEGANRL